MADIKRLKELCIEGAKLIDDLCEAYKTHLLPDDQKIRDEMESAGNDEEPT